MKLIEQFIYRPILTNAISIIIVLLGLYGLYKLPIRYLPKIEQNSIEIKTIYPGADSASVKNNVTLKLQNALIDLSEIDYITSQSKTGISQIKIFFTANANLNNMLTLVIEKIRSIQNDLPVDAQIPQITKTESENQAMLIIGFVGSTYSRGDITEYLQKTIQPQIESIKGVSRAEIWGEKNILKISLNPSALSSYHLTPQDIVNALYRQNAQATPGSTQGNYFDYNLKMTTDLQDSFDFNRIIIKAINRIPIRLNDVGEAKIESDDSSLVYMNGRSTVLMGVFTAPNSNPITTIQSVLNKIDQLKNIFPADVSVQTILNRADYVHASLLEVIKTLIVSIIIVAFVMYCFLNNIQAAFVPVITIPISLIGVCFYMQLLGYSLNTVTLLGMVLAVGLVVDDAIIIIENILRHKQNNLSSIRAAITATKELIIPIIIMTVTLALVYLPIGWSSGITGKLFKEFSVTLAGSVFISGVIALTLTPMIGARIRLNTKKQGIKK